MKYLDATVGGVGRCPREEAWGQERPHHDQKRSLSNLIPQLLTKTRPGASDDTDPLTQTSGPWLLNGSTSLWQRFPSVQPACSVPNPASFPGQLHRKALCQAKGSTVTNLNSLIVVLFSGCACGHSQARNRPKPQQ